MLQELGIRLHDGRRSKWATSGSHLEHRRLLRECVEQLQTGTLHLRRHLAAHRCLEQLSDQRRHILLKVGIFDWQ